MSTEVTYLPGRHRFGWYKSKQGMTMDIHVQSTPINEEIWSEFRKYTRVVELFRAYMIDYLALDADFSAVLSVEEEVGSAITDVLASGMISIPKGVQANARAQQLVSNFLGASSAFRDRAASRLSRQFGTDSLEVAAFSDAVSRAYDSSFAYRVLYALRNYAQHREVPISLAPINADRCADGNMAARIDLYLNVNTLLESPKLNSKLRVELMAISGKKLSLRHLFIECMAALRGLMAVIIESFQSGFEEMGHYAIAMCRMLELPEEAVPVIWEGSDPSAGPGSQRRYIAFGFDELVRALELKDELREALTHAQFRNAPDDALV